MRAAVRVPAQVGSQVPAVHRQSRSPGRLLSIWRLQALPEQGCAEPTGSHRDLALLIISLKACTSEGEMSNKTEMCLREDSSARAPDHLEAEAPRWPL